jgi:hypothetical protein
VQAEGPSLEEARAAADAFAAEEIARVEAEHRARDPGVVLRLSDYAVTVSDVEVPDPAWSFLYEYERPDPPFALWLGHGMHFSVRIPKAGGDPVLIGGE